MEVTGPVGVLIVIVAGEIAMFAPNIVLPCARKFPIIGPAIVVAFCTALMLPPTPLKPSPKESKTYNVNIEP